MVNELNRISSLYNRAYDLIWNEWFRDENLQNSLVIPMGDGPDDPGIYALRKRNKRKDYLTSCLPWPQKGDAVEIGIAGTAPVTITGNGGPISVTSSLLAGLGGPSHLRQWRQPGVDLKTVWTEPAVSGSNLTADAYWAQTGLQGVADLSNASALTINALRQAALYQQILELDARGGTRYVENLYFRFGVISPDFRLQRPELS